jgi:glucosamine--fructose-6-phosphate aminotransferase (isomerizing)
MCGIVGYVGSREARPLLLAGLEKLEYRGYDSAGISVLKDGRIDAVRAVGNLGALRGAIAARGVAEADGSIPPADGAGGAVALAEAPEQPDDSRAAQNGEAGRRARGGRETGIGHTRWATHGRVTTSSSTGSSRTISRSSSSCSTRARCSPRRPTPR